MIYDACHSSSIANLPYTYNILSHDLDQESKHTDIKASIVSISGCKDHQTSTAGENTRDLSALTKSVLYVLKERGHDNIRAADFIRMLRVDLLRRHFRQIPTLAFSRQDDLGARIC